MGKQRGIVLGCLAEPLTEQLAGRIGDETLQRFEEDAQAINRLYVRGVLLAGETEKARRRLIRAIKVAASNRPSGGE